MANTTIIVPIFNALDDLKSCLKHLKQHTSFEQPVLLINDASTDPELVPWLTQWMESVPDSWSLIHNEKNLGFVGTVNRGMKSCLNDVVLLNSDTVVSSGWLESILQCASSDNKIATITPFTNNGEIASWPELCVNNPWPDNINAIAQACRDTKADGYQDLPTAVGFCMWIRRAALETVGYFDEVAFGRGYGEENDFSQKAIANGWRNVLCDAAFVAHLGGASFSPLGLKPNGEALDIIKQRYPNYIDDVMRFIRNDPLKVRRKEIQAYLEHLKDKQS